MVRGNLLLDGIARTPLADAYLVTETCSWSDQKSDLCPQTTGYAMRQYRGTTGSFAKMRLDGGPCGRLRSRGTESRGSVLAWPGLNHGTERRQHGDATP